MSELYDGPSTNTKNRRGWLLTQEHDLLGYQNFTKGRISSKYVEMQGSYYGSQESQEGHRRNKSHKVYRRSETQWAAEFIENLIRIVHDQWTWKNEKLLFQKYPGAKTSFKYEQILKRIMNKLEMTDLEDIRPED